MIFDIDIPITWLHLYMIEVYNEQIYSLHISGFILNNN